MRLVLTLLVVLFAWLQYELWVGKGSKTELSELRSAIENLIEKNAELKERNDALQAEVNDLKSGFAAIEELARSEMGMIKKDEAFYQIINGIPEKIPNNSDKSSDKTLDKNEK